MPSTAASEQPGRDPASKPGKGLDAVSPRRRRLRRAYQAQAARWRENQRLVLACLALAALLLGFIGYRQAQGGTFSTADALYGSIQLFGMQSSLEPGVPVALNVARFLAPLVVGYAAVKALLAIFREQAELASVAMLRGHVVVVGLGDKGRRLAFSLHSEGHRVAVVDQDPQNASLRGCRARRIPVVRGDGADPAVLRRARVGRAGFLFLSAGADATNLAVAGAARQIRSGGGKRALTAIAHLDDLALWRLLRVEAVAASEVSPAMRLEYFNLYEAAARKLLSRHPPLARADRTETERAEIIVYGSSRLSESFIVQLAREVLAEGAENRLDLTLAGPGARRNYERLITANAGLDEVLEMHAVDLEDLEELEHRGEAGQGRTTYIFLERETAGMAAALRLAPQRSEGHHVVISVEDADAGVVAAVRSPRGALGKVDVFDVFSAGLSNDVLLGGVNEVLARAKHDHYVTKEHERGTEPVDNPSMVPWEQLPEGLKDSNRSFADGMGEKLKAMGLALVPAALPSTSPPQLSLSRENLEELARGEHDRWVSALKSQGWKHTAGAKDPERKAHPLLVSWSELPESERDKDREPVQELPLLLHRAGLDIRPTHEQTTSSIVPAAGA